MSLDPITAALDLGAKLLDKIVPDPAQKAQAQLELLKLAQTGELAQLAADTALTKGQLDINAEEAKNTSLFVAGWRPSVGWVGSLGLAYASIIEPLARFVAQVGFHYNGSFPVIDTTITMQVLFGILGLGAMRSFDKKNK